MAPPYEPTSHEAFSHDSIEHLGYDWSRAADPKMPARPPTKVYFPRTTSDVQAAVRETHLLRQRLVVRGKGHSSNELVFGEVVLCTENLNQDGQDKDGLLNLNLACPSAVVQAGVVLATLEQMLAPRGLGLPIIGDHNHITAGGFAAVGGCSPASHVHGLFVDNVLALEYVDS
ncbi:MAG TPA: FAD-dependent oxidoreductase, partial [Vicinamibacteria bacterium]